MAINEPWVEKLQGLCVHTEVGLQTTVTTGVGTVYTKKQVQDPYDKKVDSLRAY